MEVIGSRPIFINEFLGYNCDFAKFMSCIGSLHQLQPIAYANVDGDQHESHEGLSISLINAEHTLKLPSHPQFCFCFVRIVEIKHLSLFPHAVHLNLYRSVLRNRQHVNKVTWTHK